MVSAATLAATIASISTPVTAVVAALAVMFTPFPAIFAVISIWLSGTAWHMGINSEVRLAAMIPARRAASSGSPFGLRASSAITLGDMATNAVASAARRVGCLPDTSTMRARPVES